MSTVLILLLMGYTLIEPEICIQGATSGLLLWFNKVLPSLLPFIILSQLLFKLGVIFKLERYIGSYAQKLFGVSGSSLITFVLGSIGGSPTGAKLTNQLLLQPNISLVEAQKTLCFSNNCGPLFIIGTVGTLMLGDVRLGYFLAFIHILSALTILVLSRFYRMPNPNKSRLSQKYDDSPAFVTAFTDSVQGGMETIVYVGGFIIFFSMILNIIKNLEIFNMFVDGVSNFLNVEPIVFEGILLGSLEFSNGTAYIAPYYSTHPEVLGILSAVIAFGGFCVFFQSAHILSNTKLSLGLYLLAKVIQAIFAYVITVILYPFFVAYTTGVQVVTSYFMISIFVVMFGLIAFVLHNWSKKDLMALQKAVLIK
ncbi:MAG: hypothetical protein ATN35_04285 [Epulopiscium sp. Nele67-Bin004]|nr:MAG: hypothetical protein ATN35_04285 [Epulopiscium sp. Nele67-Bin004]